MLCWETANQSSTSIKFFFASLASKNRQRLKFSEIENWKQMITCNKPPSLALSGRSAQKQPSAFQHYQNSWKHFKSSAAGIEREKKLMRHRSATLPSFRLGLQIAPELILNRLEASVPIDAHLKTTRIPYSLCSKLIRSRKALRAIRRVLQKLKTLAGTKLHEHPKPNNMVLASTLILDGTKSWCLEARPNIH